MKFLTWSWLARDLAAVGAAVSVLVTDNILSGTAQHYTVSILAAVNAAVMLFVSPTLKEHEVSAIVQKNIPDNSKDQAGTIVPPKNN